MAAPIEVGVLGATGMVGQYFVSKLARHPWFRLSWLAASGRSEGRRYGEVVAWRLPDPLPAAASGLTVAAASPGGAPHLLFSALDSSVAGEVETAFASAGHIVVSNSRNHRMDPDVPLLIPEINPDHVKLVASQRRERGWGGAIVTNPNCSTVVLAMSLAPLCRFGLRRVMVTTLQAVSGAGYPGVPSLDVLGNVIPFIDGEEEKVESESLKILGTLANGRVEPHAAVISAQTTRVPVSNGHTMTVSVELAERPSVLDIRRAFEEFSGRPQQLRLPSAPTQPLVYLDGPARPQPRLDVSLGDGMTVSIGRLRPCPVLTVKYVALGDNLVRGAAGAALLNAELMSVEGMLS